MSDLVVVSGLVGSLLPGLVALVNQAAWPSWGKALVAAGSSLVAGVVTAAAHGSLTGTSAGAAVLAVTAAALGAYHAWWRPSGIGRKIEVSTSIGTAGTPAGPPPPAG